MKSKKTILSVAIALLLICAIGGTVAWLTADDGTVKNTFTESDIDITLTETKPVDKSAQMVPGWTIDKDPKVTVDADSEDCWLFVKITESTSPDLDTYIAYAIASGWESVQEEDANGVTVIGRKVYKGEGASGFGILGAGTYTDDAGTITWADNQVGVKPSVNETKMTEISTTNPTFKPTLTFDAYAVQLFKTNSNNDKDNTADEFTKAEAWDKAKNLI